jgi:hypothetical protein
MSKINKLLEDETIRKKLAKVIVLTCFRNSELENLHAGITPSSKTGDYSDVIVKTPYGEIPWNKLSRFGDEEMKKLIIDVVNNTYSYLTMFAKEKRYPKDLLESLEKHDICTEWNEPKDIFSKTPYEYLKPL